MLKWSKFNPKVLRVLSAPNGEGTGGRHSYGVCGEGVVLTCGPLLDMLVGAQVEKD